MIENRETGDSSSVYPRIYQVDPNTWRVLSGVGLALVSLFIVMAILRLVGIVHPPLGKGDLLGLLLSLALAFGLFFIVNRMVILRENAIEIVTWFSRRRLTRQEILGYRVQVGSRGGMRYIIVPRDDRKHPMRLPGLLRHDKYFFAWMRTIQQLQG